MSDISENIRNFRKFRGMTQRELAASLNVTITSVASWERGSANFGVDTFVKLCKVLKATPNQICGIDSCPELETFLDKQKQKEEQTKRLKKYSELMKQKLNTPDN